MITVLKNSWALFLGVLLLMLGNGLQGTLLAIRGAIEGFSPTMMSLVMSGYFVGFLGGSRITPKLIRRVGHVRVFAALASLTSACLILYAAWPNQYFWFFLRIIVGFSFSGIYVVAESWLNNSATNKTRGQILSLYLILQMLGITLAQVILNFADPGGFMLFILASVVLSFSFMPILLSINPAPAYHITKPMRLYDLMIASPLGVIGIFLLGAVFAAIFGMSPVFGTEKGFSVNDITIFVAAIYFGGMVWQFPIGWLSDYLDRRLLIIGLTLIGGVASFGGMFIESGFLLYVSVVFVIGGVSNPLYSLYIAYTNDFLEYEDMAAAAGGLIFVNGLGAIVGPFVVGWMMGRFGANSFFIYIGALMLLMGGYALYRMTQRAAPTVEETASYTPIAPTISPVLTEVAQEYAIKQAMKEEREQEEIKSEPAL